MRTSTVAVCCILVPAAGCFQAALVSMQSASTVVNRCANPTLPRMTFPTEDKTEMLAEVMKHLEIGMPVNRARSILLSNGFWHVLDHVTNDVVEKETYRRPRSSGWLGAHLFSGQVIVVTLHREGEVVRKVSLNYFDRDPDKLPAAAKEDVSTPEGKEAEAPPKGS